MTKEMYEDLLERNKLQISELNTNIRTKYTYRRTRRTILKRGGIMKELTYEEWQKNPTPRMMLLI